jgi:hypothetical protein
MRPANADWSLLVYLAGDNSLTEEMTWSLQEIKKTSARLDLAGKINVAAHFDPRGSRGRSYEFVRGGGAQLQKMQGQPEDDGNLGSYVNIFYTDGFVDASVARQVAHEAFAPKIIPNGNDRERLGRRLSSYLAKEPLGDALRRDSNAAADFVVEGLLRTLSATDRALLKNVNLVGPLQRRLRRMAACLVDTGDASKTLSAFVWDQINRLAPADEYFVILSGHGSGAVGDFLTDVDPGSSLSIPDLGRILREARSLYAERFGHFESDNKTPKRIGIVGMDSCLMSTAEVCFEISDHARLLVSSEGFVSNTGWPYHRVLEAMVRNDKNPDPEPRSVAVKVAQSYADFYQDYEISDFSTDISVCDLEKLRGDGQGSLVGRLRAFSQKCIPRLEELCAWEMFPGSSKGNTALSTLCREIATDLKTDIAARKKVETELLDGSADAQALLENADWSKIELTVSQSLALWGLVDSIRREYHHPANETLKERLEKTDIRSVVRSPQSGRNALAVTRVLREFDPGIEEALKLTEAKEATGDLVASRARERLRKLHQVRWTLDLQRMLNNVKRPGPADARLRDDLVASRWQAQSFKAGLYVDLFDFCQCLEGRRKDALSKLCGEIQKSIEGAVVDSHRTGPDFQHAHGLSVYLPVEALDYAAEYENLAFAEKTGWGRFVRAYLRATRRARRDEDRYWAEPDRPVLRFGGMEVDPLETDSIEARITGVSGPPADGERCLPEHVRGGSEKRIRAGSEKRIRGGSEKRIRGGSEKRIRGGSEKRIRGGSEKRIKGEGILAILGNPPDGFYRQ